MYCQHCGQLTVQREVDGRVRPACPACGKVTYLDPKLAVAIVIERDGTFLLGRRAAWTRSPGAWSFPAGFVDRGEQVEAAAEREVREEVGLIVRIGDVLGVFSTAGDPTVVIAYTAEFAPGNPVAGDELTDVGWFGPDELPDLAFAHDRDIISRWQRWREWRAPRAIA